MKFSDIKQKLSDFPKWIAEMNTLTRILRLLWFPMLFCFLEFFIHLFAYRSFSGNFAWVILFSFGLGSVFTFLTTVFPRIVNTVLTYLFTFVFTLIFEAQLIYFEIFKGFAPVSSLKLGGQAITNFTDGLVTGIKSAIWWIFLLLIPFIVLSVFGIWLRPRFSRLKPLEFLIPVIASVVFFGGTIGVMALFFSGTPSIYNTFSSSKTSTDTSVNYFGMNTTIIQEFRWLIFPDTRKPGRTLSTTIPSTGTQAADELDFKTLYEKAGDNENLKDLTADVSNMPTTQRHDYSGFCEDYNLIAICAEAFCMDVINPELTPTLYKLSTNGFVFNNFYATFPNTTTNGEYTFLMGLYTDMSREKTDSSFGVSASNYLPYCYGNLFTEAGASAYAYHNYVGEFYYRNQTHPNMGYKFKAANSGLNIPITTPSSDLDMIVESVNDYALTGERFTAYYMTYSGHYPYGPSNAMTSKNWDTVKDLPLSDAVKSYIACNLELEYALAHLMQSLEDAGIADETMIVLTTDHFPYGLTDEEFTELAAYNGREVNNVFDKQKNSFICYVPNMDPVQVDSYCSTVDILPTVLNLLGFPYDSRLLAGHDILAPDAIHVATLADGSFITDGISYDASTMKFEYTEENDESKKRGEELYALIEQRFRVSTGILNNDYYSFVFDEKSSSEKIDNLTTQYKDVGIMIQSAVYYLLKHDIMDPVSDTEFGIYAKATTLEVIDSIYRIAGRPAVNAAEVNAPFTVDEKYADAVAWTYSEGILIDDSAIFDTIDGNIKIGQFSFLLERTAAYFGVDTTVDEDVVEAMSTKYSNLDERIIRASIYCRDRNIITGDGNEEYVFYTATQTIDRGFSATSVYRLSSYYILPDDE